MNSRIARKVVPFGAVIAAMLFVLVVVFSLAFSNVTHAGNGSVSRQQGRLLTIFDRGEKKVVLSQEATIGDALKDAGISVDEKDVVEPAITEKLIASDYQVNIYRARPVVIVDGGTRTKISTAYQTASQIVQSAGIKIYDEDKMTLSPTSNIISEGAGLQVVIDRSTEFEFTLYGKTSHARTLGKTVADMLDEKGIDLTADDQIVPTMDTVVEPGMLVRVWREGKQVISVDEPVAFEVEKIEDADRSVGTSEIKIPGVDGMRSVSYEIIIQDGVEIGRKEIASIVTLQPKKQTEIVGVRGQYTTPSENETITWDYLINKGFTRIQTAGIMGNLMQEHRFNTSDVSGGLGIAQWIDGRRDKLMQLANYENIYVQLDYLMSELDNGYTSARDSIKSATNLEQVVAIFESDFERCNPHYCMFSNRLKYAQDILASH